MDNKGDLHILAPSDFNSKEILLSEDAHFGALRSTASTPLSIYLISVFPQGYFIFLEVWRWDLHKVLMGSFLPMPVVNRYFNGVFDSSQ